MQNVWRLVFGLALGLFVSAPAPVAAAGNLSTQSRAVVKFYVTKQRWDLRQPWTKSGAQQVTCSGFFVEQGILTNAHCVADAAFIQVEIQGYPEKFEARVDSVNHQIDLALVKPYNSELAKEIKPIRLGALPSHRDKVVTVGFPTGGRQVSYTEGVVSRIDVMGFAHSNLPALLVQTDAAINPGNSGGPVFAETSGKCIGVATQKNRYAEAQGFFVPTPMIEQFLSDRADGTIEGIPNLGITFQNLENDALRDYLKLPTGATGIRVREVAKGASADGVLKPDDVLLEIEGDQIFTDGRILFSNGAKIGIGYHIYPKSVGDNLDLKISRGGEVRDIELTLKPYRFSVIPHMPGYDQKPDYVFKGGMVFQVAEPRLVGTANNKRFPTALLPYWSMPYGTDGLEDVVVISAIYDASINKGYGRQSRYVRVMSVNGREIFDLDDLREAFAAVADEHYLIIDLENQERVVLDQRELAEIDPKIRATYNIPAP